MRAFLRAPACFWWMVVICTHSGGCFGLCVHMAKLAWILSFTLRRAQALGFARTPDFSGQCWHLLPIGMRDRLRELSVFEADTAFYCHGCSSELRLCNFAHTSSKWARCQLLPARVRFQIEPFEGACTGLGCALSVPCTGQYRYRAGLNPCPYRCCTVGAPVFNSALTAKQRESNGKANAFGQRKGPQKMRPFDTMTSTPPHFWMLVVGTHRHHQFSLERQSYIAAARLYGTLSGQMYSKRVTRL